MCLRANFDAPKWRNRFVYKHVEEIKGELRSPVYGADFIWRSGKTKKAKHPDRERGIHVFKTLAFARSAKARSQSLTSDNGKIIKLEVDPVDCRVTDGKFTASYGKAKMVKLVGALR